MKIKFCNELKAYTRSELLRTRAALGISQEEMARKLMLSSRAYAALESGRSCCSFPTFVLLMLNCYPDRNVFFDGIPSPVKTYEAVR